MKKVIKTILKVICFILLVCLTNRILIYMLVDDSENQFRYSMHEFYHQENIDVLFLGSSHVFCGVDPSVLEETWDNDVYLAATSVQKPDGSYYLLKEAVKQYDLKTVYLDMYYWQYRDEPSERTEYQMDYIRCITDYMKPSIDKYKFIFDASSTEYYLESLFIPSRYTDKFFVLEYIEQIVKSKRTSEYLNYECPEEIAENYYKGFINSYGSVTPGSLTYMSDSAAIESIREEPISKYSMKYLRKIIKLCKQNNIELVLFTTPMTAFHCEALGNYDTFSQTVSELAEHYGIQFYDFNLLKKEVNVYSDDLFLDSHHLNGTGAAIFAGDLAEIMGENDWQYRKEYFYDNLDEKNKASQPQCYGLLIEQRDDSYRINPVENRDDLELEYRITEDSAETGESRIIQEYDSCNEFEISVLGETVITVEARQKGDTDNCNEIQFTIMNGE